MFLKQLVVCFCPTILGVKYLYCC